MSNILEAFSAYRLEGAAQWLWNMDVSFRWGNAKEQLVASKFPDDGLGDRWPELALLNALLAVRGDRVLLESPQYRDDELLQYWRGLGLIDEGVGFALIEEPSRSPAGSSEFLICFGNSETEARMAADRNLLLFGGSAEASKVCNSKTVAKRWCEELGLPTPLGRVCRSLDEIETTCRELFGRFEKVVIKDPYGASGKGILLATSMSRVTRLLARGSDPLSGAVECLVEGWYPSSVSHNSQWMVLPSGKITALGQTEQILDLQKYKGNRIRPWWREIRQAPLLDGQLRVVQRAFEHGYHGILGIDSVETIEGETFPAIEINARLNLSTYAMAVLGKLGLHSEGCLKSYIIRRAQSLSFGEFLSKNLPGLAYRRDKRSGVLPLAFTGASSPAWRGKLRMVLLVVAETKEQLADDVRRLDTLASALSGEAKQ